jgi:hypothetical protein
MAESVPCYAFLCRKCGVPILLPCDAYKELNPSQWVQPTDEMPVILVCDSCKHANIYSPLQNSRYYHPTDRSGTCFRTGETDRLLSLECAGGNREFRVPVIITWIDGIREGEKQEIAATWIGGHLECPNKHQIFWPWRQSDVAQKSPVG